MSIIQTAKSKISKFIGNLIYKKFMPGFGGKVIGRDNWPGPLETGAKYNPKFGDKAEYDDFMFQSHRYPQGVGNIDEGHFMAFMIIEKKDSKVTNKGFRNNTISNTDIDVITSGGTQSTKSIHFESSSTDRLSSNFVDKNIFVPRGVSSGFRKRGIKEVEILTNMVFLYTPAGIATNYGIEYAGTPTGMFGAVKKGGKTLAEGIGRDVKTSMDAFKARGIPGVMENMSFKDTFDATKQVIRGSGALIRTIVENITGEGMKAAGQAGSNTMVNPHMELMMTGPQFRTFTFSYTFAPRNKKELESAHKIIKTFKYHMLPSLRGAGTTEHLLDMPSQFEIRYMFRDKENLYLPKISRCYCDTVDVNYTPNDKFTTFKGDGGGASPNIIKMDLKFQELEIMTKDTIAQGY